MKLIVAPMLILLSGSNLEAMLARGNRFGVAAKQIQSTWSMLPHQAPILARPPFVPQISRRAFSSELMRHLVTRLSSLSTVKAQTNNESFFDHMGWFCFVGVSSVVGGVVFVDHQQTLKLDAAQEDWDSDLKYLYYPVGWHIQNKSVSKAWAVNNMDKLLDQSLGIKGKKYLIMAVANNILTPDDVFQHDTFKKLLKATLWPIRHMGLTDNGCYNSMSFDKALRFLVSMSQVNAKTAQSLVQVILDIGFIDETWLNGIDPELMCYFKKECAYQCTGESKDHDYKKVTDAIFAIAKNAQSAELTKKLLQTPWGPRLDPIRREQKKLEKLAEKQAKTDLQSQAEAKKSAPWEKDEPQ